MVKYTKTKQFRYKKRKSKGVNNSKIKMGKMRPSISKHKTKKFLRKKTKKIRVYNRKSIKMPLSMSGGYTDINLFEATNEDLDYLADIYTKKILDDNYSITSLQGVDKISKIEQVLAAEHDIPGLYKNQQSIQTRILNRLDDHFKRLYPDKTEDEINSMTLDKYNKFEAFNQNEIERITR